MIQNILEEYFSISSELKRLNDKGKILRKRKKELNTLISDFIKQNGNPISYKGIVFDTEEKSKSKMKPKEDKKESIIQVLRKYGIDDAENVYEELESSQRINQVEPKLKIKNPK